MQEHDFVSFSSSFGMPEQDVSYHHRQVIGGFTERRGVVCSARLTRSVAQRRERDLWICGVEELSRTVTGIITSKSSNSRVSFSQVRLLGMRFVQGKYGIAAKAFVNPSTELKAQLNSMRSA